MTPTLYICLGRNGDLLNILPMLWRDAQSGTRPKLMVAAEYAPLLEGVSYVEPVVFNGPHYDIAAAVAQAKALAGLDERVVCLQVNGPADQVRAHTYTPAGLTSAVTSSFQKEAWRVAGRLSEFHERPPLIFDRRSPEREKALLAKHPTTGRNKFGLILVASHGNSSPFPYAELLSELVRLAFVRGYVVLPLPQAERLYDLLAFYERAHCLVVVDSAPLHLARACPDLPVFALTNDRPLPWNGSAWSPNWAWSCRYRDFPERAVEMIELMGRCRDKARQPFIEVWNAYEAPPRKLAPVRTRLPVLPGSCGRDAASIVKDSKRIPFLRDCLKMGLARAQSGERVCLRRPDVRLSDDAELTAHVACFAYRMQEARFVPVADMFCATKEWWQARLADIPDLLFGADYFWSECLLRLFKAHGAADVTGACFRSSPKPVTEDRKEEPPRVEHNRNLFDVFTKARGEFHRYPAVSEQVETLPLDTSALPRFAYNPSVGRDDGKLWISYRHHPAPGDYSTRLGIAQIVEGKAVNPKDFAFAGESHEDARLFRFHGALSMSWVQASGLRTAAARSIVKYAHLTSPEFKSEREYIVEQWANDWSTMQKNWCFFESNENLLCIYRPEPTQVLLRVTGEKVTNEYSGEAVRWPYGQIRGGCVVPFDGKMLRFFHSSQRNERFGARQRYYVGALLMEDNNHQPGKVLAVSQRPILYGSEAPAADCFHAKPGVVFPGGAVAEGNGWLLALGVNDAGIALAKITPAQLNL